MEDIKMAYCNSIKLEKGMYNVGGKSFTDVLEGLDPSENYKGSPLEGLDAYQRQLKRFDIKVSGPGCDVVEKFFSTADSAVLFPEFLARAIKQGIKASDVLSSIVAATTKIDGVDYRSINSSTETSSSTYVTEGGSIRSVTVKKNSDLVSLKKHGRLFSSSYEALRFQNLDVIAVILKQIGMDIAKEQLSDALTELLSSGDTAATEVKATYATTPSAPALTYSHLLQLWKGLSPYRLNVMLASSATINDILSLSEMRDATSGLDFQGTGNIVTPMGAKLILCEGVAANKVVGLDKDFALQMIQSGDVVVEYDKLIDKQLERAGITMTTGFSRIFKDAVKVLDYGVSSQ